MFDSLSDASWLTLAPFLLGKGSSTSNAAANVRAETSFNPTITIGSTTPAAADDSTDLDLKTLLSTPVVIQAAAPSADQRAALVTDPEPEPINKGLALVAVALYLMRRRGRG